MSEQTKPNPKEAGPENKETQPAKKDAKPENQVTQPANQEAESAQQIEATVKQNTSELAETIPTPKAKEPVDDIAETIAAPAEKDSAEIHREEQDVPIEWKEGQTILDLYEVKQVHTGGGMGLVYRVHHKNWNIDLAVKSPRANYFKTEVQKENFIKECETWINLGLHPNIVSCYYVRTLGGIPRVFAEYVEGGSLKDWIDNKKLYEGGKEKALERILDVSIQFAWGLHYSHEKDLVHQDVKPANVMMTEDGTAKVTDFGLAKARATAGEDGSGDAQQSILVSSGGMTPAYCSPEQANKQPLSRKTDIWSWGLSVLEMFAGEVFWRAGQIAQDVLKSFLETDAEDDSIPKMLDAVVTLLRQCFQDNPDDRPNGMQEITGKLKEIYKQAVGQEYPRQAPKVTELFADNLNNKAVSLLDLGKKAEAEKLWHEALRLVPGHPEAMNNKLLYLEIDRSGYAPAQQSFLLCQPFVAHVRNEVGNLNIHLANPDSIVKLGEAGLAAAIRLFREPKDLDGFVNLNQAVLACALVEFAKRGDRRAQDFLFDVAQGRVPIIMGSEGDAAFEIAQSYVYGF